MPRHSESKATLRGINRAVKLTHKIRRFYQLLLLTEQFVLDAQVVSPATGSEIEALQTEYSKIYDETEQASINLTVLTGTSSINALSAQTRDHMQKRKILNIN